MTVLEDNDVATLIAIKLTKNIIHVEGAIVGTGWHLDWVGWLSEVLDQVLRHHDLRFESLFFLARFLSNGDWRGGTLLNSLFNRLNVLLAQHFVRHLRLSVFALRCFPRPLGLLLGNASLALKLLSLGKKLGSLELVLFFLEFGCSLGLSAFKILPLSLQTLAFKALTLDAFLGLAQLLQPLGLSFLVLCGPGGCKLFLFIVKKLLLLKDTLFLFARTTVIFSLLAFAIFFFLALASLLLFFDALQASFLFLAKSLHARALLGIKSR